MGGLFIPVKFIGVHFHVVRIETLLAETFMQHLDYRSVIDHRIDHGSDHVFSSPRKLAYEGTDVYTCGIQTRVGIMVWGWYYFLMNYYTT